MKKSTYNILFFLGFVLWILENTYFGWNATAQSGAERLVDMVCSVLLYVGVTGSIAVSAVERYLDDID